MLIDVLIVGQGLAGSLLAWQLISKGFTVVVVDNAAINASRVAAGLVNPVTGQRLVKTQGLEDYLPEAMTFYRSLSTIFQQQFFVAKPMYRVLSTVKLRQLAEQRLLDAAYRGYLETIVDSVLGIRSEHGLLLQCQTGYLRTAALLDKLRDWLISRRAYLESEFDHNELQLQPKLQWRQFKPTHIVFCEGYRMRHNPWFGSLPLQPAKGEILHCHSERQEQAPIINYGSWMIPLGNGYFKTGASFDPQCIDLLPTEDARHRLSQGVAMVCPQLAGAEIVEHSVGIRPTTIDKQPFVGSHPQYPNLHVFNGFGAKGSLAIPYFGKCFVENLSQAKPLPKQCNIKRYYDAHFPD